MLATVYLIGAIAEILFRIEKYVCQINYIYRKDPQNLSFIRSTFIRVA